jgi:Rrf2 family protein
MDLGRRADYALRAMVALCHSRRRLKAREIAAATAVPAGYLPQVLANLVRAGVVTSEAGPRGGYAPSRSPAEISLLDVIEAASGPLRSWLCPLRGGRCGPDGLCAIHEAWGGAQDALIERLAQTSLEAVGGLEEAASWQQEPTR